MNLKNLFRAFKHKNYRIFFLGPSISLTGTWMQYVALSWLVYRLTNSPLMLGMVGFFGQMPTFFVTPFAGVLADRHNRRHILIITQTLAMLQAFTLSFLVLTGKIEVWHIFALSIVLGFVNSFDIPTRQAFVLEMVGNKEDLANAIALNASMVNATRLLGPSLAGIFIALWGEGLCFLVNAVSYIPIIISFSMMRTAKIKRHAPEHKILKELREGFKYAASSPSIKYVLLLLGIVSFLAVPYQVLMPIFARNIFSGDSRTLGFLMGMAGFGALCGALVLAGRANTTGLIRIIGISSFGVSFMIIIFSLSRNLIFSMAVIAFTGFFMMVQMVSSNTVLQTVASEDKRGRVMSFYTMAFIGVTPFASLIAGTVAFKIGAPNTLLLCGIFSLFSAFVFERKLSKIYN